MPTLATAGSLDTVGGTAGTSPRARSAFVVRQVTATVVVAGNIYFARPPTGVRPRVSAAAAFGAARQTWGDPRGTAMPEVVLISYTNDGQGDMLAAGGIRRFNVNRLVWAVIDQGAPCASSGPPDPGQRRTFTDCLFISFVDARTGQSQGSMDEGGPHVARLDFEPAAPSVARSPSEVLTSPEPSTSVTGGGSRP